MRAENEREWVESEDETSEEEVEAEEEQTDDSEEMPALIEMPPLVSHSESEWKSGRKILANI